MSVENSSRRETFRWSRALLAAVLASVMLSAMGLADDVFVVRFQTGIVYSSTTTECYKVGWRDHLLFRNTTDQDLSVSALATSNGYVLPGPEPLVIPARSNRSLLIIPRFGEPAESNHWTQTGSLVVNRLDVPAGVLVESRGELWGPDYNPMPCQVCVGCVSSPDVFGTFPLPVVRTLTPAGVEQVHMASDLGTQLIRTNVGVYNGGASPANVSIEIRRACDDVVVGARSATIPADTVTQFAGFTDPKPSGCTRTGTPYYSRYVVVVMDQPGFSFVTVIASDFPPRIAITSSVAR